MNHDDIESGSALGVFGYLVGNIFDMIIFSQMSPGLIQQRMRSIETDEPSAAFPQGFGYMSAQCA